MALAQNQRQRLDELKQTVSDHVAAFVKVAIALAEIRRDKLWALDGYNTFQEFCRGEFNFGSSYGRELAQAGDVLKGLLHETDGIPAVLPTAASQVRELAKAPTPEQQREAWELSLETTGGEPTARAVKSAVAQVTAPEITTTARVRDTQQKATPGSTAVVVDGPLHIGAEVKVTKVEANGGLIHAETPSGRVHPFLAGEIEITEQADPPQPKPTPKQIIEQLRALLERVLKEELTDELVAEIQAALA